MSTTTITATCACKNFSLSMSFPEADLPLAATLCLCTSCRKLSGTCGSSYICLPTSIPPMDLSLYALGTYEPSDKIRQYFCSTCGANILSYRKRDDTWHLATGIWDKTEGLLDWTGCKWVGDTKDGGVSIWLKEIEDSRGKREMKRWSADKDGEMVPEGMLQNLSSKQRKEVNNDNLKAQCHCGGVKFQITRPTSTSSKVYSPFPDLMIPYHSTESTKNPNHEPWFLRNSNTKYLAGTCTCTSCRNSLGFEIQTWAFIPKCNILQENGEELDFKMGTLKRYESSDGVHREFCGVCGATVFWHCEERPELIDVSAGLPDPSEGARVEGWLDWWTKRVSFEEMTVSTSLVGALERGLRGSGKGL